MAKLFDKITGTSTNYESDGITDSLVSWTTDQFKDWYVKVGSTEYQITSNTSTKLFFENSLSANAGYEVVFVGRTKMLELESDVSDTVKITDGIIAKKYSQSNNDIHNKIFAYLKPFFTDSFNPLENILNLTCMQQVFAYYVLAKIYQDLSIDQDSFEAFKGYNMYEKSFNDGIKDSLAMLQLDLNDDGVANASEIIHTISSSSFMSR